MFANFKLVEVTIERNCKKESTGRFKSQKWHFQVIFRPQNPLFLPHWTISRDYFTPELDSTAKITIEKRLKTNILLILVF